MENKTITKPSNKSYLIENANQKELSNQKKEQIKPSINLQKQN